MQSTEIFLDGERLTFEEVIAAAYGRPNEPRLVLSDAAKQNVNRSSRSSRVSTAREERLTFCFAASDKTRRGSFGRP